MFSLTHQPIDKFKLHDAVQHPSCGAVVTFEGVIRNHHNGKTVTHLFYEAYTELAVHEGENIIRRAQQQFVIESAHCVHRLGELHISDIAVWIGVAAAHRDPAFSACRFIIDEIKKSVPIWKKEFYADEQEGIWQHPPRTD